MKKCEFCGCENKTKNKFCGRSCAGKFSSIKKGHVLQQILKFTCKECSSIFERQYRKSRKNHKYEFCGHECSSIYKSKIGVGYCGNKKKLEYLTSVYGEEEALRRMALMSAGKSAGTVKRNTGRVVTAATRAKTSATVTANAIPHPWTGKTLVEVVGEERAKELSANHSKVLKEGFSSGRLKPTGTPRAGLTETSVPGLKVRGSYEHRFIEYITSIGMVNDVDYVYEPNEDRLPYINENGKKSTYFPDFRIGDDVYEIKPFNLIDEPKNKKKFRAARKRFGKDHFIVITEHELKHLESGTKCSNTKCLCHRRK